MSNTIFYLECPGEVKTALDKRKVAYGNTGARTSSQHTWLYEKSAWAAASAAKDPSRTYTVPRGSQSITVRTGGFKNLYERKQESGYTPPPNITSVKLYNVGDFGSVLRCELAFTVYNLSQLSEHQAFFDPGNKLNVQFGWNNPNGIMDSNGKQETDTTYYNGDVSFEGIIVNFSFSVNPDGSFACTSTAYSEGVNAAYVTVDGSSNIKVDNADARNETITLNNLTAQLNAVKSKLQNNTFNELGFASVSIKNDFTDPNNTDTGQSYYVTLFYFTRIVNTILKQTIKENPPRLLTVDPDTKEQYAKGTMPKDTTNFVSGDPRVILFPGYSVYGSKNFLQNLDGTTLADKFKAGDLGATMINIDWLIKEIVKTPTITISELFNNIFEQIYICSGKRFTLSLALRPKRSASAVIPKDIIITDPNYFDSKVVPYTITAVTTNSICRNISLVSKVPAAMAVQAYYANSNTQTLKTGTTVDLFGEATPISEEEKNDIRQSLKSAIDVVSGINFVTMTPADQKMDIDTIFSNLQTALAQYYFNIDTEISRGKRLIPFPVDFTATLDGINGFEFGHTITCNYLPPVYQQNNIVFTVTKVEHTVQNNDWTTTLSTVCRIAPKVN